MTIGKLLDLDSLAAREHAGGDPEIELRAKELLSRRRYRNAAGIDNLLGYLLLGILIICGAVGLWVAPRYLVDGSATSIWMSFLPGALLSAVTVWLVKSQPGKEVNRFLLAVSQVYLVALLGYYLGGRSETHFMLFVSVALLSVYRDWRVLVAALAASAVDHLVRGALAPSSIFGATEDPVWSTVGHLLGLTLEVAFLGYTGIRLKREMRDCVYETASLSVRNERAFLADQAMLDLVSRATLGDLTYRLDKEERDAAGMVGVGLENMMESLGQLVKQVQVLGESVASSADELESGVLEHQATVTQQASIARSLTRSAETILGTSQELADSVSGVSKAADETAELAARSQRALAVMNESNALVDESSAKVVKRLRVLSEKASNISSVLTTINKVADQTNLLSLNAAIEAEKAGEAGRGFGVVAQEIRRLADQTAVSTLDVESMIKQMQVAVQEGVEEMDDFVAQVRGRASEVEGVAKQLRYVIEAVEMMIPQFDIFSQGMDEQSGLSREISGSLNMLHEQAEGAVDSIHHSLLTLHELRDLVYVMQQGVARFKVGDFEVEE